MEAGVTVRGLFDRIFQREEMDGDGRCATYLVRWTLLKLPRGIGVYLHKFVGDDWSWDMHDHPKRFVSIGLKGAYRELTPSNDVIGHIFRAPWLRTFPAEHVHRIELLPDRRCCWTLVVVLTTTRKWGFWHAGRWVPWREYVASDAATEMKSCID
jgi:hypothetical protein